MQTSRPINAFGLLFSVLWARLTGRKDASSTIPMEDLDAGTVGIGVLLGLTAVVGLGLVAAATISGLNAIFHSA